MPSGEANRLAPCHTCSRVRSTSDPLVECSFVVFLSTRFPFLPEKAKNNDFVGAIQTLDFFRLFIEDTPPCPSVSADFINEHPERLHEGLNVRTATFSSRRAIHSAQRGLHRV